MQQILRGHLFWLGLALALIYWLVETLVHVFIFHAGPFADQFWPMANANELGMRSFTSSLFITLGLIAQIFYQRQRRIATRCLNSENCLAEAERIAQLGSWQWELGSNRMHWSPYLYEIFGLCPKEFAGTYEAFLELVHADDRDAVNQAIQDALHGKGAFDMELRIVRPDGGRRIIHGQAKVFADEAGRPLRMVGVALDVSERRQTEAALRKLSRAIEQTNESVLIADKDGLIEYVNPAFSKLTGYAADEVVGMAIPTVLQSGAHDAAFYRRFWQTISKGETWNGFIVDRRKDGSFYPAMMSVAPVRDKAGAISHYIGIQQDMTEQKRLEEQFQQTQKMEALGTLVGGIAHDFNNMLAGMLGNLHLAKAEMEDRPLALRRLAAMEKLSHRAADMIKQLLTFARKDMVRMRMFPLLPFLKETIRLARSSIPENIHLSFEAVDADPIVNGDPAQLQQAVMNLLANAKDAVEEVEQPRIEVALAPFCPDDAFVKTHSEYAGRPLVRLSVRDNGYGIPPEVRDKIFEPFFTTKGVGSGTGLGLAMVYGAMQMHGGIVDVESEPGKGCAFHLILPLVEREGGVLAEEAGEVAAGEGELILLADDEPSVLEIHAEVLASLGYRVLTAGDGEQALERFRQSRQDVALAVLDVVMPKMGGVDAAMQMREHRPDLPIIFATGYAKEHALGMYAEVEHSLMLTKPFAVEQLSQAIKQLLAAA